MPHLVDGRRASDSSRTRGRYPGDPRLTELIQDLMLRSPEFRAWWPDHEVLGAEEGHKTFNHPQVGYLMFEHLTFQVFDAQISK